MAQNLWQDFQIETGLFSNSIFSFWRFFSLPSSSSMRPELRISFQPAKTASKNGQDSRQNQGKGVPLQEKFTKESSTWIGPHGMKILGKKKNIQTAPNGEVPIYTCFFWGAFCIFPLSDHSQMFERTSKGSYEQIHSW